MTRSGFLAYLADPFSVRRATFFLQSGGRETRRVSAQEVSAVCGQLVTIDLPSLVDELRRHGCPPPAQVIDIGEALRLAAGRPRDEGGERQWSVWRHLIPCFENAETGRQFERVARSRADWPEVDAMPELMGKAHACLLKECLTG